MSSRSWLGAVLVAWALVPLACGDDDSKRKPPPALDAGDSGSAGTSGRAAGGSSGGDAAGSGAADASSGAAGTGVGDASGGSGGVAGTSGAGGTDTGGSGGAGGAGAATTVTLSELPVGLSQVARTFVTCDIVQDRQGNFLFSETNRIRRLSADLGRISTVAGVAQSGSTDGNATDARFSSPCGLAIDAANNLYVADAGNATIRRIAQDGTVSTLAGQAGQTGTANATGNAARFGQPFKLAFGPDGDLYVTDASNHRIRRVTPGGVVTSYAGGSSPTVEPSYVDGAPDAARFSLPRGLAFAANGDLYVTDYGNSRIRRIVRSGTAASAVETFAGNGQTSEPQASIDDVGTAAGIRNPTALALLNGGLYTADAGGLLRRIDLTSKVVTTFSGSRTNLPGFADGSGPTVRMQQCEGLTAAADGSLFAVTHPGAVRRITPAGVVTTIMSNPGVDALGTRTSDDGVTRAGELFQSPSAIAIDGAGSAFVTDDSLRTLRRITPSGQVSLVAGLAGSYHGGIDGVGSEAQFTNLNAIAIDGAGNGYVGDRFSVRKITVDGRVTTLAGAYDQFGAVDARGAAARFQVITGIAVDGAGNVFVADGANAAIRRIDPSGNVTTHAGSLTHPGYTDGAPASARFTNPTGLAFGPGGVLYVADTGNCAIRKIASDGNVSTLYRGSCSTFSPYFIAVATDTTVFFTDLVTNSVGKVLPQGSVETLIPKATDGQTHLGSNASIFQPTGIAIAGPKELLVTTRYLLVLKAVLP